MLSQKKPHAPLLVVPSPSIPSSFSLTRHYRIIDVLGYWDFINHVITGRPSSWLQPTEISPPLVPKERTKQAKPIDARVNTKGSCCGVNKRIATRINRCLHCHPHIHPDLSVVCHVSVGRVIYLVTCVTNFESAKMQIYHDQSSITKWSTSLIVNSKTEVKHTLHRDRR